MPVRIWSLIMILVLALPSAAAAHAPVFLRDNQSGVVERRRIDDPQKSWAVYGRLGIGRSADLIPVRGVKGEPFYAQVIVPVKDDLTQFRPQAVLLGPGLTGMAPEDSPVQPGPGEGALILNNPSEPRTIYEGFTQMWLWEYGTALIAFPETGTYRLVVYDPAEEGGPFTVAIGKKEEFGPIDVLTFPLVWVRARIWLWK